MLYVFTYIIIYRKLGKILFIEKLDVIKKKYYEYKILIFFVVIIIFIIIIIMFITYEA